MRMRFTLTALSAAMIALGGMAAISPAALAQASAPGGDSAMEQVPGKAAPGATVSGKNTMKTAPGQESDRPPVPGQTAEGSTISGKDTMKSMPGTDGEKEQVPGMKAPSSTVTGK